jgi:hypothetical protein
MSKLITIGQYNTRIEAEVDKGLLESNGIKALIFADDAGGARPHLNLAGRVKLLIREEDRDKATKLLKGGTK